ncbi:MAG TPA: hypothetical protein VE733_27785 [Streptosporangiaceae bacterium]|nr:hypothetical protein [Streptosporangiaceae bacterium]
MGRPPGYQWEPLGLDADPVPGDPGRISQEAAHLAAVARQISDQVAALRKIGAGGADGALKGQYADKIHSSANDLAGQLGKVAGRYQKVSAALNGWILGLEQAQSMSIQALNQAEGPHAKLNQAVVLPSGSNLTPQQKQDIQNYHTSMQRAQAELDAAKALLNKATTLRDNSASYHAGLINKAIDDAVKDSWWDRFKDWVGQYAWLIRDVCTGLEVIATILAIAALFIPGVNIVAALLWIGFGLTAAALVGRLMLAATGNGSWFDVALDAFALLTFGLGKAAAGALKGMAEGTETLGEGLVQGERGVMMAKGQIFLDKAGSLFDDAARAKIMSQFEGKVAELVPEVGKYEGKLPLFVRAALRIGGTSEDAENFGKILAVWQRFAGNAAVAASLASGKAFAGALGLNAAPVSPRVSAPPPSAAWNSTVRTASRYTSDRSR